MNCLSYVLIDFSTFLFDLILSDFGGFIDCTFIIALQDITTAVKSWYLNGDNYGLALVSENEGGAYKYATFYTSRYPNITTAKLPSATISYLNQEGFEDYLTYHNAGSGTMGDIAVGDFNGNLVYTYTDLSMTGNYMPVTIQHIYNHSKRKLSGVVSSSMYYGLGMRLNLSQKIEASTVSGYPYKYTDADGTIHYFVLQSGTSGANGSVYAKENDNTTTITKTSTGFTLSTSSTVEYRFNTLGFLSSVTDNSNGKTMTLAYTSDRLTSVTDGAGRVTTLAYSGNYLSSITDPAGRSTSYSYSSGHLSQITKPDGTKVKLAYTYSNSSYMLTSIEDIDGSKITMSYYPYAPHRVASLTELGTAGAEGNRLTWTYSAGETTVTDRSGKSETMMFDNSGHTVCIRDGEGNAVYGAYNNTSGNNKNSLKYQSEMQTSITNYLYNHDFEDASYSPWYNYIVSATGNLSQTTAVVYCGSKSAMIESTSNTGRVGYMQATTVPGCRGQAITVSAYVKITDITTTDADYSGLFLGIGYQRADGVWATAASPSFKATTDWQRMTHTFIIPSDALSESLRMSVAFNCAYGTAYVDNAQLETGAVANRYNLLDNGHFREAVNATSATNWSRGSINTATDMIVPGRDGNGYKITGNSTATKYLEQTVSISGNAGDSYVFGGWLKADALAKTNKMGGSNRDCAIRIYFVDNNGSNSAISYFNFEAKTSNWQYLSGSVTAPCDYKAVKYSVLYYRQKNVAIFDDLQLYREQFGVRMEYDNYGRMISSTDSMGRTTTYAYAADKRPEISKITYADGTETNYTYDTTTWRLLSVTDANGKTATYSYDANGNATGVAMVVDGQSMSSGATTYTGSYVATTTDSFGNTISYNYNQSKGTLNSVTDAEGTTTSYTYNASNDHLTNISAVGSKVDYGYTYGKLASIAHNTDGNVANDVTYSFNYDQYGNTNSVAVGNQTLISHTYAANNGLLIRSDYGNGDYKVPTYDTLDRVTAMSYNGIEGYNWVYGADGRVGLHNDLINDVTWRYEYTKDGSLTSVSGSNGERFTYTYDTATGKLLSVTAYGGSTSKTTTYNYSDHTNGEDANLINSVVLPIGTVNYDYDGFYRASYDVEVNNNGILTANYSFVNGTAANSTSFVVESMTTAGNNWSNTLSYTYDDNSNIVTISEGSALKATYTYDGLNQLVREDNVWLGKTITYTYDKGGNIQLVKEYALTSGALDGLTALDTYEYLYGDANWRDKLTSYDGNAITYDAIGNPLTYYNGYTFDWQNGRQLASVTGNGLSASYKYNADGIRTQKTVNGVTTGYTLEGSSVVKETNGTDTLWYYYDAAGALSSFELNGIAYFYVKNQQGDIIAVADANGNKVVEYLYDSWGRLISTTGLLANTVGVKNPYRYRGYRYDVETGLYYVCSRYYDPEICRFINADTITDGGAGVLGNNLFMYAANNPMNNSDPSGHWIIKNAIKWIAKNVVKPVVKNVQKALSKVNATYSRGIIVSGSPSAFSFNLQAGISIDTKGNVAIQGSFSGGVTGGSPGASITAYQTVTNAPNIKKLEGPGYQIGGSVGVPVYGVSIAAGRDFNIIPDANLDKTYYGATTNVGFGTPGGEFHVEWGETATLNKTQFNVFDVAKGIYVKIMEW